MSLFVGLFFSSTEGVYFLNLLEEYKSRCQCSKTGISEKVAGFTFRIQCSVNSPRFEFSISCMPYSVPGVPEMEPA